MKYIKTFETKIISLVLPRYKGKIFINTPSTNYFKSSIALQVVFVDSVKTVYEAERLPSEQPIVYQITADDAIQCNVGGSINYTDWNQEYVNWEFDKIKFMTPEEFYKSHEELFIKILEMTISENLTKKTDFYKDKINGIIKKLTIPETEHIVDAEKYNL